MKYKAMGYFKQPDVFICMQVFPQENLLKAIKSKKFLE